MAKDFIEEAQQEAKLRFGRELSSQELGRKFMGHDFEARIFHLKNPESNDEPISLGDAMSAAKRLAFERSLHDVHNRLRKINR